MIAKTPTGSSALVSSRPQNSDRCAGIREL